MWCLKVCGGSLENVAMFVMSENDVSITAPSEKYVWISHNTGIIHNASMILSLWMLDYLFERCTSSIIIAEECCKLFQCELGIDLFIVIDFLSHSFLALFVHCSSAERVFGP